MGAELKGKAREKREEEEEERLVNDITDDSSTANGSLILFTEAGKSPFLSQVRSPIRHH